MRLTTLKLTMAALGVLLAVNDEPVKVKEEAPFQPAPKVPQPDPHQYQQPEIRMAGSMLPTRMRDFRHSIELMPMTRMPRWRAS